jgi:hypothetical protein
VDVGVVGGPLCREGVDEVADAAPGMDGVEGARAGLRVEDEVGAGLGEREGDRGADACGWRAWTGP